VQSKKAGRWVVNAAKKVGNAIAKVAKKVGRWFSSWGRRRRAISQRDEHFDIHIRKRRFISKWICEGLVGGGCRGISHLCYGACKVVDHIGQGLCNVVDIAVGALKLAEAVTGWINSAIQFLMQMFLVHSIKFELGLGEKYNGFMVGAEVDLTLFGKRFYFGFRFDLKNPFRSITSAKDSGMTRYKKGVKQKRTATTYDPYDKPNPFGDFDLSDTFGIESLQTAGEIRVGSCITALTTRDKAQLVLVGCNSTDERQQWTYTLKGALINLYSKKCLVMPNKAGSTLYQNDCEKDTNLQATECDVVTRTLKLRRSNLCVTSAKTSPHGPGSIAHLGSLKCIHLASSQNLVLRTGCNRVDTEFEIDSAKHLMFKARKLCARAKGAAVAGAKIQLVPQSMGCHEFGFTKYGSLQHITSGLCVQTPKKEMKPNDYTELVLGTRCEFTKDRPSGSLPDAQMVFTFVPKDNTLQMKECADFYDSVMEQRFAVMDEELHSVCSKFAVDIALHKDATQSSVNHNGFPNRAVDGDFDNFWDKGSCTQTKEQMDPWWRVDLGGEYVVTDVTVINRGDRHGERLKNFMVHIGNNMNVRRNPVCHDIVRQAQEGEAVRLTCDPPIPGKYVGVQIYGKGILTMCEVIVASRFGVLADWCLIENGGCEQLCHNHCNQKTTCSCLPGYTLAYDRKTCIDINECLINNGGCRRDKNANCINYAGGHFCSCSKGFILKDDSLTECTDMNECGYGNGGCQQLCNNTHGGYLCDCRKGFERKPNDLYGCQNIDECLVKNGGCSHNCHDFDGGRFCSCRPGHRLMEDGKTCEELYCSVLETPRWGLINPATCTKKYENIPIGTVCTTDCSKGYEKTSTANKLTCKIDGTWDRASVGCYPVKCPIISRPANGGVVPARCHDDARGYNEFGQRCVTYCKHGYKLRGPSTKHCQADKKWSNSDDTVKCVKIISPPYLNCPIDVIADLPPTQSWMTLGSLWKGPQTNIEASKVKMRPETVGPNYKFRPGRHLISYTATDDSYKTVFCSFFVEIKDTTPPQMINCPANISKTSSNDMDVIHWNEPTFTDNVGVHMVTKPLRKPGSTWYSGESIRLQYVASDLAGNDRICSFQVSFKSISCPLLTSTATTKIDMYSPRSSYGASCVDSEKTFFGNLGYNGVYAFCRGGDYYVDDQINIGITFPECVKYKQSTAGEECEIGSQKFSIEDYWVGGIFDYYCSQCRTGTYYETTSKTCVGCEIGYYQDEQGQSSCEMCPIGSSTEAVGSSSSKQCLASCAPGSYSESGLNKQNQPCQLCPKGTYSSFNGTKVCKSCAGGTTTRQPGATNPDACYVPVKITHTNPFTETTSYEQATIELVCIFEGHPQPTAVWTKLNGNLPKNHHIELLYGLDMDVIGTSLTMKKVEVADSGKYKCSVDNGHGTDERSIQVTVLRKY